MMTRSSVCNAAFCFFMTVGSAAFSDPTPLEVFNQRIAPILRSSDPSSCIQCHLASVDLKQYILPSSDATFVSLREQGLIDLEHPKQSKILEFIRMGEKDLDEAARLIHKKTRKAEFTAFEAWIEACVQDDRLCNLPATSKLAKPSVPDEVIRHGRKSRILDSFARHVWSQRLRCFPCHTHDDIDPENPKHQAGIKKLAELREQYGQEMLDRLAIFRKSPEATLSYLIESSRNTPSDRLPLLDLENPKNSLVLLKPMSKVPQKREDGSFQDPSNVLPLSHLGGLKLHKDDQSYKAIVTWIQDYANVVEGRYQSLEELPADNWFPSKSALRMKDAPEAWKVGDLVQLFVHGWDENAQAWAEEPLAFTQSIVTPRRMVNGVLILLGTNGKAPIEKLPRGRYLVKTYWDSKDKIANAPSTMLSKSDFAGQAELKNARWREGFRLAEMISGLDLSP